MSAQDSTAPVTVPVAVAPPDPAEAAISAAISEDPVGAIVRYSQTWLAAVAPQRLTVEAANPAFCRAFGVPLEACAAVGKTALLALPPQPLTDLLPHLSPEALQDWYHRQVGCWALLTLNPNHRQARREMERPEIVPLGDDRDALGQWGQLWLRGNALTVTVRPTSATAALLAAPVADLETYLSQFSLADCEVSGWLLLEGMDITAQERIRQLSDWLLDGCSILEPEKFCRINQVLRHMFRAQVSFVLRTDGDHVQISLGTRLVPRKLAVIPREELEGSQFAAAIAAGRVWTVQTLAAESDNPCERYFYRLGIRSLLLIPLQGQSNGGGAKGEDQSLGLVGMGGTAEEQFDRVDEERANALLPALRAALRRTAQSRFNNIHPAVEWRFTQEAERRSWGLPPQPIAFEDVYPLYGISDIRGSSLERDRAIQADLLAQLRLALAVVEAACEARDLPLARQLRDDLRDRLEQYSLGITVSSELEGAQYLQEQVETHLDYFASLGGATAIAVDAYREACNNDRGGVYEARAAYDLELHRLTEQLRRAWERWQERMQAIVPHYCDIEITDGLDHMIYAGQSISPDFSPFQLHSLRYEQLRAVCDCARTGLAFEASGSGSRLQLTHLVLVQEATVDIVHDENTERLFDVRGTRDTRYEIVKKRIDKACDALTGERITQPGMLTVVYATPEEGAEYQQYLRYLEREGWIGNGRETGPVESLKGANGLRFVRVQVLPEEASTPHQEADRAADGQQLPQGATVADEGDRRRHQQGRRDRAASIVAGLQD